MQKEQNIALGVLGSTVHLYRPPRRTLQHLGRELLGQCHGLVATTTVHHDQLIPGSKRDTVQGRRKMLLLIERWHNH